MRLALLAALLLVPIAAADPAPTLRSCSEFHCALVQDADGDGDYDWANVATAAQEQLTVNANYDASKDRALWHVDTTNEELGGHEAEAIAEEAGLHVEVITVEHTGESNATSGAHDATLFVSRGDHETGIQEGILFVRAHAVLP